MTDIIDHMRSEQANSYAVFLDGPIGVGKTTYGRRLAAEFSGQFVDGDDHSRPDVPWYGSSLSTSRGILRAILQALDSAPTVFVAYPIRRINWIFFKRRLADHRIETVLVGLQAQVHSIADDKRERQFSEPELNRSKEMIVQGYGSRPFNDFEIQTDAGDVDEVTELAKAALQERLHS